MRVTKKINISNIQSLEGVLVMARFWKQVDIKGENDCWNWKGKGTKKGYARFFFNHKSKLIHHFMLFMTGKYISKIDRYEKCTDHLCRNPRCVNPKHLEIVSFKENILRGNGITARKKRQKFCKRGHLLDKKHIVGWVWKHRGGRQCKRCGQDNQNKYRARKRANKLSANEISKL